MAFTYGITFTIQDEKGKTSDTSVNLPTTYTLGAYQEMARALAALFDDICAGVITAAMFFLNVDISGLANNLAPLDDADIEEKGYFKFRTVDGTSVDIKIPAFDASFMSAGSDDIDVADASVAPLVSIFEDGLSVTGGTITPCDVGESDIDALVFARESYDPRRNRS